MIKNINKKLNKWCAKRLDDWEERIISRSINTLWQMPIIGVIMLGISIFRGIDGLLQLGPFETLIMVISSVFIENIIRKVIIYKKIKRK